MSIEFTVICDGCARIIDASSRSAKAARRIAVAQRLMRKYGDKELCRECWPIKDQLAYPGPVTTSDL
jgi:hypothetical protein